MKSKCTNENVMLSVDVLHRHPQNPRKGVGDVTELADSIKKNGVMQNLTVIPGYWDGSGNHHDEEYTLLIGHKQHEEAKRIAIEALINAIPIPKGATNGDVIKAMFPNISIYEHGSTYSVNNEYNFNSTWWNAPYKAQNEK